ncbi:LysR family transcriptional regulator [Rhizobium sp. KVB221]|uniref:LysR family transcriptional regulator n=1 Tax=Rhizobium setariae TaxID=2801340 RepID=A0A936YQI7_9HYPH|nr:LysR family transcriptional regulator [Rhizobium setariae]MBL0370722.1 LysR family transcriptional regulator [Rhizobium setariae]
MKNINWDAYQIFLIVARQRGLTGAALMTGLSPATIGRRILQLEEATGLSLFHRSQNGYTLTTDGEALFSELREMESAVRRVESWRQESGGLVTVRIAVGTWIGWLLMENFRALCAARDPFRIEFTVGERRAQLTHRENDIGIRAFEPEEPNLASRAISEVAYAAYRLKNASDVDRWIAVGETEAISNYLRWTHQNHAGQIIATVDRPRSMFDLVRAGAGIGVLPCFIGDLDPMLERVGGEIVELRHRQWLVTHNDDRSRREIRTLSDRMAKLLKSHSDVFAGRRPSRTG